MLGRRRSRRLWLLPPGPPAAPSGGLLWRPAAAGAGRSRVIAGLLRVGTRRGSSVLPAGGAASRAGRGSSCFWKCRLPQQPGFCPRSGAVAFAAPGQFPELSPAVLGSSSASGTGTIGHSSPYLKMNQSCFQISYFWYPSLLVCIRSARVTTPAAWIYFCTMEGEKVLCLSYYLCNCLVCFS